MSCITRGIMRWGLIGGLGLAGVTLLVGPERVGAGLAQIRTKAQGVIDQCVDDPVAIRRQLEQLASQYPNRMAEVRGELSEVESQIGEIGQELERDNLVVAMTTEDLTALKGKIALAEAEVESTTRPVFIRFDGVRFDVDEARDEALRIGSIRTNYRDRVAFSQQQLKLLQEQQARLTGILQKLDEDYSTYQTQLYTLDRQIHAIERNERLIELVKEQQQTLESYDRYATVGNVRQLQARLTELTKLQTAQLETLSKNGIRNDYESRASYELQNEKDDETFKQLLDELDSESLPEAAPASTSKSIAMVDPIIIE